MRLYFKVVQLVRKRKMRIWIDLKKTTFTAFQILDNDKICEYHEWKSTFLLLSRQLNSSKIKNFCNFLAAAQFWNKKSKRPDQILVFFHFFAKFFTQSTSSFFKSDMTKYTGTFVFYHSETWQNSDVCWLFTKFLHFLRFRTVNRK